MPSPCVAGNLVSIGVGAIVTVGVSLIWPEDFDFESTRNLNMGSSGAHVSRQPEAPATPDADADDKDFAAEKEGGLDALPAATTAPASPRSPAALEEPEIDFVGLNKAFRFARWCSVTLFTILIVLIPLPLFGSSHVFSVRDFTAWVSVSIAWALIATVVVRPSHSPGPRAPLGDTLTPPSCSFLALRRRLWCTLSGSRATRSATSSTASTSTCSTRCAPPPCPLPPASLAPALTPSPDPFSLRDVGLGRVQGLDIANPYPVLSFQPISLSRRAPRVPSRPTFRDMHAPPDHPCVSSYERSAARASVRPPCIMYVGSAARLDTGGRGRPKRASACRECGQRAPRADRERLAPTLEPMRLCAGRAI